MGILRKVADQVAFWSEPVGSPDFGKSREDWQAARDAARAADGRDD